MHMGAQQMQQLLHGTLVPDWYLKRLASYASAPCMGAHMHPVTCVWGPCIVNNV